MRAWFRPRWMRRSDGGELLERFLVSGIVSVLVIRWALALTGYPKLGGGGLHIAHMLWGGLLMLIALVLLLLFLERRVHRAAAIVAGLGFGTFVDEIGKFITSDNDYFFRPAVAIIYVVFVALFLLTRAVISERAQTSGEALANAMDVLQPGARGRLDRRARALGLSLLRRADQADPLVPALRAWVAQRPAGPATESGLDRLESLGNRLYEAAIADPLFERAVITIMAVDAAVTVTAAVTLLVLLGTGAGSITATVSGVAQTLSAVVGALLVLRGLPELRRSRFAAYRWFRRGVVVWILVTQLFVFYHSQLAGVAGLGLHVLTYAVLTYMLSHELAHEAAQSPVGA
ncbi:MAG TPA: hypothetical protein VK600_01850 [Candidatus Saccharimonadales bacterium]|nr:hypothetical protein [Candidatus Saccharimonadales bacterium]